MFFFRESIAQNILRRQDSKVKDKRISHSLHIRGPRRRAIARETEMIATPAAQMPKILFRHAVQRSLARPPFLVSLSECKCAPCGGMRHAICSEPMQLSCTQPSSRSSWQSPPQESPLSVRRLFSSPHVPSQNGSLLAASNAAPKARTVMFSPSMCRLNPRCISF